MQQAYELFNSGVSLTRIGKELGVDRHRIGSRLKEQYHIDVKATSNQNCKYDYNSELAFAIVEDYKAIGIDSLSKKYKISTNTIINILKYHNVPLRKMGGQKTYKLNSKTFEKIDTEEKAYWLGFLYADGYVTTKAGKNKNQYRLELCLKSADREHLEKFKKFLHSNAKIYKKSIQLNGKTYTANRIGICDKQIVSDLIKHGCIENKSLVLTFPDDTIIPHNLKKHFIRGYLDGDGSIVNGTSVVTSFLGTKQFLCGLMTFLNKEIHTSIRTIEKKNNINYIRYFKDTTKLLNYLYEDAKIYLNRKYAKYAVLIQLPQKD